MSRRVVALMCFAVLALTPSALAAQIAVANHDVNLRPTASSHQPPIRAILAGDTLTLLATSTTNGYFHVETRTDHKKGYVYKTYVDTATATTPAPVATITMLSPPIAGSASEVGCGDGLWAHVYNPSRLHVNAHCITVTGTILDATASQSTHEPDGVRHEGDGDTHGWLKLDPQFAYLLNAGNASAEGGNLVYEIVCHYTVTQADAVASCTAFGDHTVIPPVGTHVAIKGTYVQDMNHSKWMEIHPVTSITVAP